MADVQNNEGINTEGDANINADVVGIGSDIHIHQYNEARKLDSGDFFKKVRRGSEIEFKPIISDAVKKTITEHRAIIISCESGIDMLDYQNGIVEFIQSKLDLDAFEMIENQEDQSISTHLLKEEDKGIYLLSELDVSHIGYDLTELLNIALRKDFYLIITTNSTKTRWLLGGDQLNDLWVELNSETLYNPDFFRDKLNKELSSISFIETPKRAKNSFLLSDSLTSTDVLKIIDRPIKLTFFLQIYSQLSELPSDDKLRKILVEVSGRPEEIIERWFRRLSHPEKLIAIAFALFDGVRISQFFEAICRLLSEKSVWTISAPKLAAIDLKDITFLEPFLHEDFTRNDGFIISSRPDFRRVVFQTLWRTHRRHLMDVFPNIVDVISESYRRNTTNWELFGTPDRRSTIRKSFVNAISDLGSINLDASEGILLDLAATGHYYVQNLVASSLVRWRGINKDEQFFNLLNRWQQDESVVELVKEKLARREKTLSYDSDGRLAAVDKIKCTVAITLSRAAQYDKRNALDPRLIELYGELARSDSESVRFTIEKSLPKFIHKHISQLKPLLFENLMKTECYRDGISEGLMLSFMDRSKETKLLLDQWLMQCMVEQSLENRREKSTYRDNILMTIIGVLIRVVDQSKLKTLYTDDELYSKIIQLLKSEGRNSVRQVVLQLAASLMGRDCKSIAPYIQNISNSFKKTERKSFIQKLTSQYVYQRSKLSGGDVMWEVIPDFNIAVWFKRSMRPLTPLESEMIEWVNKSKSTTKEIAVLFFLEIASAIEESEIEFIKEEQNRIIEEEHLRRARENAKRMIITTPQAAPIGLSFMLKVKIFFILLFESRENKRALKDILRFLFNVKGYKIIHIRIMNNKWKKHDPNRLTGKLGKWLDRLI